MITASLIALFLCWLVRRNDNKPEASLTERSWTKPQMWCEIKITTRDGAVICGSYTCVLPTEDNDRLEFQQYAKKRIMQTIQKNGAFKGDICIPAREIKKIQVKTLDSVF